MKVRRDISSIPLRTAEATWAEIRTLVTGPVSIDEQQLDAAESVMASLIADELYGSEPLTFKGVGDRLVIYLRHGLEALEEGTEVDEIQWNPTAGDWTLYVPCGDENYEWAKKTLAKRAPRFVVMKQGEMPDDADEPGDAAEAVEVATIDWEALKQ